jgi:hypothetical protein
MLNVGVTVPENPSAVSLEEIAAEQKISVQAQILKFSHDWSAQVDRLIDYHVSQLVEKMEARVSIQIDAAVIDAGYKSRRASSEVLNQLMRRLRQSRSPEEVAAWLVDSTAPFCGQAALFEVIQKRVRGVYARGFPIASNASIEELETPLDLAPAFDHAVIERDIVIALGSPAEVSPQVVAMLAHAPTEKVHLYPIVIRDRAVAILYAAAGGSQPVDGAGLELLTHAAAYAVQILTPDEATVTRPAAASELILIDGVDMQTHRRGAQTLLRQALEARARWFARTEVARMRLFHRTALEQGRMQSNIYSKLRPAIDAARRSYSQDFLAVSPAMADYLHRELLVLAHDDANLLGPEYPGSLA